MPSLTQILVLDTAKKVLRLSGAYDEESVAWMVMRFLSSFPQHKIDERKLSLLLGSQPFSFLFPAAE